MKFDGFFSGGLPGGPEYGNRLYKSIISFSTLTIHLGHSGILSRVSTASLPAMALRVPDSALFYSVYVFVPLKIKTVILCNIPAS